MRPSGPKATFVTMPSLTSSDAKRNRSPSLTSSNAERSRSPRVEDDNAAGADAVVVTDGDPALRAEGHAHDGALVDRQRRPTGPFPARVEDHHAAAVGAAAVDAEGVTGGDAALWAEGYAPDAALGNREDEPGVGAPALLERRRRGANGSSLGTPGLAGSFGLCAKASTPAVLPVRTTNTHASVFDRASHMVLIPFSARVATSAGTTPAAAIEPST